MAKLSNWVKQAVSGTPGTGTISLGSAVSTYIRFQDSGLLTTGDKVHYSIEDGANREMGIGTITTGSPWTLSRDVVQATLVAGVYNDTTPTAINLSSGAVVSVAPTALSTGLIVGRALATTGAVTPCTAVLAADNTTPQSSEATTVISVAYAAKFADSILRLEAEFWGSASVASQRQIACFFKDADANCLRTKYLSSNETAINSGYLLEGSLFYEHLPGDTASHTYKLAIGVNTGTFYLNSLDSSGTAAFNSTGYTNLRVTEVRSQ